MDTFNTNNLEQYVDLMLNAFPDDILTIDADIQAVIDRTLYRYASDRNLHFVDYHEYAFLAHGLFTDEIKAYDYEQSETAYNERQIGDPYLSVKPDKGLTDKKK